MSDDYLIVNNPNKAARECIARRIKENNGYCLCKKEKNQDTKCECKKLRENGECECGLFIKVPCIVVTEGG